MTEDYFTVYEYMVSKFGGVSYANLSDFDSGVKSGAATKRFIPSKIWGMYNIDTNEILAEGYLCRYGFDLIKIKNKKVTEYYRRLLSNKRYCFVAYNIESLELIESYSNIDNQLRKYDWLSGDLRQANNNCTYDTLPVDFKEAISHLEYKSQVFMYAIKPYGRVVEFYYP